MTNTDSSIPQEHKEFVLDKLLNADGTYQQVINNSPDFIFESLVDTFQFTKVNKKACQFYGYSESEFLQMKIFDIEISPPLESEVRKLYDNSEIGDVLEIYGVNKKNDGSTFPVHVRFGKISQKLAIANVRDITDIKRNEEILLNKNKGRDEFAYLVSHKLKAPLQSISKRMEWIRKDIKNPELNIFDKLQLLRRNVNRLNGYIEGLLKYSNVGKSSLIYEKLKLNEMITGILETHNVTNENVIIEINENIPELLGFPILLTQVLSNIISNAIEHNNKLRCKIIIHVKVKNRFVTFSISDNGPGIPEKSKDRVFELFHTVKTKNQNERTGIGLWIVKKIISELNGQVWIENNQNEGCTIFFEIPKNDESIIYHY